MKKFKWLSIVVATFMLIATASPAFAQSETDPVEDPVVVEETNSFLDHPIVKLLSGFFSSLFEPEPAADEGTEEGDGTDPPADPTDEPDTTGDEGTGGEPVEEPTPEPTPVPTLAPDEQVAALHSDDNLGFGEITKLLQIVAESKIACASDGVNCDVTLDSLKEEYESGVGMGELFQTYGKPSVLGVGQAKKEADADLTVKEKSNNGKAKGKDK
jgi:hypothetical protein